MADDNDDEFEDDEYEDDEYEDDDDDDDDEDDDDDDDEDDDDEEERAYQEELERERERVRLEQERIAREEQERLDKERKEQELRTLLREIARESRRAVYVEASAVLGGANIPIGSLLKVGRGAVIELDTTVNDLIEVEINSKPIGKAEVVVDDDRLSVSMVKFYRA